MGFRRADGPEVGLALIDYLPVLRLAGELVEAEVERLWTDEWPEAFHDALATLPAAEHLVTGADGLTVELLDLDDTRLFVFDPQVDEAVRTRACFAIRRAEHEVVGLLLGGDDAARSVAALLGLTRALTGVEPRAAWCPRPW